MSTTKIYRFLSPFLPFGLSFLLLPPLFAPSFAQGQSSKKNKGKAESCDGAADIVPVKPMSFARKRKPASKEQTAEAKTEKKQ